MRLTRQEFVSRGVLVGVLAAVPGSAALIARLSEGGDHGVEVLHAAQPGRLPLDGRPQVAGINLPPGRRWAPSGGYNSRPHRNVAWLTDDGVDDAFDLARRLAEKFPSTGLWPVLWLYAGETPAYYSDRAVPFGAVDARKARGVLAEEWLRRPLKASWRAPLGRDFPGLADSGRPGKGFDPFGRLEERQRQDASWDRNALRPGLMLVPCARPADTIAAIGLMCGTTYSGIENPALVSSVLRSWEDRFDAVLVGLAPGAVALAVGSPPHDVDDALRLAAEHYSFASREGDGTPGAITTRARELLGGNPPQTANGRHLWEFAWND